MTDSLQTRMITMLLLHTWMCMNGRLLVDSWIGLIAMMLVLRRMRMNHNRLMLHR